MSRPKASGASRPKPPPEGVPRAGGKYIFEDEIRVTNKNRFDALVKDQARVFVGQLLEASQRLLTEAKYDDATIDEAEQLLLNEFAVQAMDAVLVAQEKIDNWRGLMVALIDRRLQDSKTSQEGI